MIVVLPASRFYLSGPIDSLDYDNRPAFHAAAKEWRMKVDAVWNPAELFGGDTTRARVDYQRLNLAELTKTSGIGNSANYYDGLLLLPGWQRSRGARLEVLIALELEMVFVDAQTGEPVPVEAILSEV